MCFGESGSVAVLLFFSSFTDFSSVFCECQNGVKTLSSHAALQTSAPNITGSLILYRFVMFPSCSSQSHEDKFLFLFLFISGFSKLC